MRGGVTTLGGMESNPADIAAGILGAAFVIGIFLYGLRTKERPAGALAVIGALCFAGLLVAWRFSCWAGHMSCS